MNLDHPSVTRFAESLKSRGKQPATIESYCRDAQRFLDYLGKYKLAPSQVAPDTLMAYQEFLRDQCEERDNSVRRTVIGIRQFFRFLTEAREISMTPFDMVPIPERDDRLPRGLEDDDIETLITVAAAGRPDIKATRDAAMVSLLAHEGVKANELISLTWADFIQERGAATIRIGGGRARAIALSKSTHDWMSTYRQHYNAVRHPVIVNSVQKHIFIAFKGRDAASPLPVMTRHGLKFILYELGERAGYSKLNTEQLRHFAVSYLLGLGKSPEEIMLHLGLRRIGNIAKHVARTARPTGPRTARVVEGATRL